MNARVFTFSVSLGMSFGILVLFISSLQAISLVVVLITASVVFSSTNDLTDIRKERNLPLIMVTTAAIVFVAVSLLANSLGVYVFYELLVLNFGILFVYIAMRVANRRTQGYPER